MQFIKHKNGVNGAMLGTQSKFNEFVRFDENEKGKHIPGESQIIK